jgi:hypothetical protein
MNEKLETVGVRLPQKTVKELKALARTREWTVSQTARKLIEQALHTNGTKRINK